MKYKIKVGIIGGSGLNNPNILTDRVERICDTPFGAPSDCLIEGNINGVPCVLLARHGRNHSIMPTNVNYRANIHALKSLGCTHVLVSTACGSLKEEFHPGDVVILDSFIDRTQKRDLTFFDGRNELYKGICHLPMEPAFCSETRKAVMNCAKDLNLKFHSYGTCVTIEGPRFSSRAESKLFKSWGCDVINMTTVPEVMSAVPEKGMILHPCHLGHKVGTSLNMATTAGLRERVNHCKRMKDYLQSLHCAKEAGLCYAAIALVTDYDCWRECADSVNVKDVLAAFKENMKKVTDLLVKAVTEMGKLNWDETIDSLQECVKKNTML